MVSKYERMGVILSHIERSAAVISLQDSGALSVSELKQEANKRLSVIGKALSGQTQFEKHLKVLREEGIIKNEEKKLHLTDEGLDIVQELTSR